MKLQIIPCTTILMVNFIYSETKKTNGVIQNYCTFLLTVICPFQVNASPGKTSAKSCQNNIVAFF